MVQGFGFQNIKETHNFHKSNESSVWKNSFRTNMIPHQQRDGVKCMCKEPKHDFSELCWIKSVLFVLKFHKYMFKMSCFIETADTPAHHHNSLIFSNFTRRDKFWTNFQNSAILVLFLWCNWGCVSCSFICSLHRRSTVGQFGHVRNCLLNPVGHSFRWKHVHVIPQVCPLQNSTAAHKHDYGSTSDLK